MQWSRTPPARVHVVAAAGVQGFEQQQLLALVTASELETGIPCGQRQEEEVKTTQVSFLGVYVKNESGGSQRDGEPVQEQVQGVQSNIIISRYVRGKLGLIWERGQRRGTVW